MKLIQILVLFFFVHQANSQSSYFNVKESQKYKNQHFSTSVLSVNTNDSNRTIIARKSSSSLIFETFDENAQGKKVINKKLERKEVFAGNLFYDNKVKIFTIHKPSKTERIINCHIYDVASNKYDKIELFKTTVEKKGSLFSGRNNKRSNFSISPNERFIAIAIDDIKKNSNSYLIHVFDAQSLKLIYSKNYYSNPEKYFNSLDMVVNDDGMVYSVGKEYLKGKRERKKQKANYSFILSKINKEKVTTARIELDENEYIQGLKMTLKEESLDLIGYYSEVNAFGIKGVSQFKLDLGDLSILYKNKSKLPIEVYEGIYGKNNASREKGRELTSFDLDHILEDEEGNTFLVAEEFYITQVYMSNGMNGGTYSTVYNYDDILITKFSADGELLWGRSIFKRSHTPSYNAFVKDGKLHVLLNSGKDLTKKRDGRLKVKKGWFESSSLYDFVYDEEGNVANEKIQDNKGKTKYIPYRGNYKKGKFVMYNHSKDSKQLMILDSK